MEQTVTIPLRYDVFSELYLEWLFRNGIKLELGIKRKSVESTQI